MYDTLELRLKKEDIGDKYKWRLYSKGFTKFVISKDLQVGLVMLTDSVFLLRKYSQYKRKF